MTMVTPAAPSANPRRKAAASETHNAKKYAITVRIEPDGRVVHLEGREAWAMRQLVRAAVTA